MNQAALDAANRAAPVMPGDPAISHAADFHLWVSRSAGGSQAAGVAARAGPRMHGKPAPPWRMRTRRIPMPKFIACLWAGLLAGLLATSPARAEPASTSSVETLLVLTKAERLLDAVYASMESSIGQGMRAATAGRSVTPEQQRVLDAAPARMAAVSESTCTRRPRSGSM